MYWFRISQIEGDENRVLRIPNSHIVEATLYGANGSTKQLSDYRYLGFLIGSIQNDDVYYLKIDCEKEAIIPIEILSESEHESKEGFKKLVLAAYYGFILAVILFNLNFYFHYRDDTYLYYILLMVSVNIPPAIKDGIFNLIVSPHIVVNFLEPLSHIICGVAGALFTYKYLDLSKIKKTFFRVVSGVIGLSLFFLVSFLVTQNFGLYVLVDTSVLLLLSICVGFGIAKFRKSPFARFFTIAYFPLLLAAYDSYFFTSLGIEFLRLNLDQYRIGTGLELVVFTVAIGYKGRIVARENRQMRIKLKEFTEGLKRIDKGVNESAATVADLIEYFRLTLREIEVLKAIANGETYREIADKLFVSENTIKFHARNIFSKLDVKNRQDASQKYLHFPSGSAS